MALEDIAFLDISIWDKMYLNEAEIVVSYRLIRVEWVKHLLKNVLSLRKWYTFRTARDMIFVLYIAFTLYF